MITLNMMERDKLSYSLRLQETYRFTFFAKVTVVRLFDTQRQRQSPPDGRVRSLMQGRAIGYRNSQLHSDSLSVLVHSILNIDQSNDDSTIHFWASIWYNLPHQGCRSRGDACSTNHRHKKSAALGNRTRLTYDDAKRRENPRYEHPVVASTAKATVALPQNTLNGGNMPLLTTKLVSRSHSFRSRQLDTR